MELGGNYFKFFMKKIYLLLFTILAVNICIGQNTNPLDQKYQPLSNSIFGVTSATGGSRQNSELKSNSLSVVVTDLARSNFRVEYERKIFDKFFFSVSGSYAFGADFMERNLNMYALRENETFSSNSKRLTSLYNDSEFESGYGYSIFLKYYFPLEESSAKFFEIGWKSDITNYVLTNTSAYNSNSLDFNTTVNHLEFLYGMSLPSGNGKIAFTHSVSLGFSLKFTNWDTYTNTPIIDNYYNSIDNFVKQDNRSSITSMAFLLKYKLGFGW